MPKIPDDIVKRIQDIAKIEDVVGDFVTLRKAGVNLTGLCPFHDDKHDGNFIVRPSTVPEKRGGNTYHCFVCMRQGRGRRADDFLMKHERLSFPDAIRWLGKKYNGASGRRARELHATATTTRTATTATADLQA